MGSDTKKLKNRIKSIDSTLHLTKAMGLVASSKIRRATDAMKKSKEYEAAVNETVALLTACPECKRSPYMQANDGERIRLIVIAGDRGLAGGYNANVFRLANEYPAAEITAIGKRTHERFGGTLYSAEDFGYPEAIALSQRFCADFLERKYDRLGIIYTKYISVMTQEAQVKWVLPLQASAKAAASGVLFEPDEMEVLNSSVPLYAAGVLISSVRESFAGEVAARRCAMDAAEKNAQEMIDALRLEYNRARQGAITQEITEIVAGSGS